MKEMKKMHSQMEGMEKEDGEEEEGFEQYEIDSAMESILRAEEIKQDPELFKLAMEKLKKKKAAITSIEGLKEKANKMDRKDTGLED